ncbi:uncharacterized protein LACBIDRAFT_304441 [Laccaria bicolor S238N-H82]|uniref:DNA 3'-5' helicase n=1 Tax=Laccaria bicolor (strain S238N-H82 / ATCC MYA-4686) TaxID=486041 RepID=B0E4D6_LACBS|nr:uncharacterized protein LACBIDRAFT_304441 [Laccaria bicolor S238N-H82]EDQ98295.1 predicted protein [Laccaria bicolor S238N-H82]|eukprot:XP_001891054.1 predicted protein [Laccaria bicolor S238N-H82]
MADVCSGKWQIVVISPEMLLSKRFIKNVLRNPEMRSRILSIVVDEAHVVSHWGSGFRKKYGTLGILRALLPKDMPMVAMSATLPARVRQDVLKKLQFDEQNYTYLNLGNDRPNVSLVVRAIQNTISSYSDLDFLIPRDIREVNDIKKCFVYADNITAGSDMMEHLYDIAPEGFREAGIIRTYSAAFSVKYPREVMALFKAGHIRILICTDAAGMGCNISDIDIVVQWKLPSSVSSFVQRAGRAARGYGRSGLVVLLVEKSAYDVDLTDPQGKTKGKPKTKKANVREPTNYAKSKDKDYAVNHGVLRGAFGGASDEIPARIEVPLDQLAIDEGLHMLVQSMDCRRKVLTEIYGNEIPQPTVACCDLCSPALLNHTRPAPPSRTSRKKNVTPGIVDKQLKKAIVKWRKEIWTHDFGDSLFGPSAILSDTAVESLSSFGNIERLIDLEIALGGYWAWFGRYGDKLLNLFKSLDVGPKQHKPPKPWAARGEKRASQPGDGDASGVKEDQPKRRRTSKFMEVPPTPVNPRPGPSSSRHTLPAPSTPMPPPFPYHHAQLPTTMSSSPLANNPYAALATPQPNHYHLPQMQRTPPSFHFPISYYYPTNTPSSSSSRQPPNPLFYPHLYPRNPPPPPPPNS